MVSKKSKSPQVAEKNYRVWRRELKALGFIGKRVSLRGKVSPAQKRTIEKYKDVVTGKAKSFSLPAKDAAKVRKMYGLKGTGKNIVVPKKKGQRITFSEKKKEITITSKGRKQIYSPEFKARPIPPGKRLFYTLEFNRGIDTERYRFEDFEELERFMYPYEHPDPNQKPKKNPWLNWRAYVVLDYLNKDEVKEAREDGDNFDPKRHKRASGKNVSGRGKRSAKTRSRSKTGKSKK